MDLSITSHANDVFLYPINPQLPESVQEHLRAESAGPAIYLASVHLKIPSHIKPKELKGGIQRIEVTLNSRETLSVSSSFEPLHLSNIGTYTNCGFSVPRWLRVGNEHAV